MTRLLRFRVIGDPNGALTPFDELPFEVRHSFILHDIPAGARRGGHAHRVLEEIIIAVAGSFDVVTLDEHGPKRWILNRASSGLYIGPCVWRHLANFSSGAVALVLASTPYDESDYIRDEATFRASLPPLAEGYMERRARLQREGGLEAMQREQ